MKNKSVRILNLIVGIINVVAFIAFAILVVSTITNGQGFTNLAESLVGSISILVFLALNAVVCFFNYLRTRKQN